MKLDIEKCLQHFEGLVHKRRNCIANALGIVLFSLTHRFVQFVQALASWNECRRIDNAIRNDIIASGYAGNDTTCSWH